MRRGWRRGSLLECVKFFLEKVVLHTELVKLLLELGGLAFPRSGNVSVGRGLSAQLHWAVSLKLVASVIEMRVSLAEFPVRRISVEDELANGLVKERVDEALNIGVDV